MVHKYPKDLVFELLSLWRESAEGLADKKERKLPEFDVLEDLVSTCYQVSQMREEARGLRFRVMICEPEEINERGESEYGGLFALRFTEPRPCNEYELMKLGPSIDYNNSLIGLRYSRPSGMQIWGLIHSGSKWVHMIHGGSKEATPLPPALAINVTGSGRLIVCRGVEILAQLSSGNIIFPSTNVFQSNWVAKLFDRLQSELATIHSKTASAERKNWSQVDPDFIPALYLEVYKHIISTMRRLGHGGAVIFVPEHLSQDLVQDNPFIALKYRFAEERQRNQLRQAVALILQELAKNCGRLYGPGYVAGWKDYVSSQTEIIRALDERIFKFARFVARLTGVDGVVVASESLEVLGFGGIIQGTFDMGESVALALDPEGKRRIVELVENVGARHRSVYYFCSQLHEAIGIVVSQDAKARVVTWKREALTCWDVIPIDFA